MTQTPTPPSWPELVTLMVHGPDLPLQGTIRHDDGGEGTYVAYAVTDDAGPVIAGSGAGDGVSRVWRHGDRLRLEDAEGRPTLICDGESVWHFRDEGEPPRVGPARRLVLGAYGTDLLERADDDLWRGDDVTRPAGPVTATTLLGRQAWSVELAPPRHQPHPVTLVVDAETGLVLRRRVDGAGVVSEWTDLVVGQQLDAALFVWDGPVVSHEAQQAEHREARRAEEAERRQWVREHLGTTQVVAEVTAALHVWSHESDGSFHGEVEGLGHLARRPRQEEPWPEAEHAAHTWSDDAWDWVLHAHELRLTVDGLQQLQRQLGSVPVGPVRRAPDHGPTTLRPDGDPAAFHRGVAAGFTALVETTAPDDWDAPAPVEGWTARDVVRHLVEWLPGLLESGAGVAIPSGPSVDDDPVRAWRVHSAAVQALLDDPASTDLVLRDPHLGEVPVPDAVSRFYTPDVFMHTWDLATATGRPRGMDAELAATVLASMEPLDEVLRRSGQYGARVEVPADADPVTRLMGFVGRQP